MFGEHKILAIIPARGGSKGVPRKNIRELNGKPLIAWTIEVAKKSRFIDRCIVSTEDNEIAAVAKKWGGDVPFMRPAELAQDGTPGIEPVLHAIELLPEYDIIVLLQATSPLRRVEDIDGCIEKCLSENAESCVSVTEAETSPYWMYTLQDKDLMKPLLSIEKEQSYQRQKLPKVYQLNGAVYVCNRSFLIKEKDFIGENTLGCVMPSERSYDIDTMEDFKLVEWILSMGCRI